MPVDKNADGVEVFKDSGAVFHCGLLPADMVRMRAAPQFGSAFPVIDKADWPKDESPSSLESFFPYSWNQGNQGSCGGHGGAAAFEAAWNFQYTEPGKPVYEFSPTFLYGLCNGGKDNGSRPDDLMEALTATGVCLRSTVGPGDIYKSHYPKAAFEEASRFKVDRALVVSSVEEMVSAVLKGMAVFSGIFIGNNFRPDANGVLPQWDGKRAGGHCTAQIGKFVNHKKVGPALWTKNSWGQEWGHDGWGLLPLSYFEGGLPAFGAVVIGACRPDPSDSTPTPTPVA